MHETMSRRRFLEVAAASAVWAAGAGPVRRASGAGAETAGVSAAAGAKTGAGQRAAAVWPFYAFDNGLASVRRIEDKVRLLKDLGYAGVEAHLNHDRLPEWLSALDKHGLALFAVYTVPFIEAPMDPRLPESIARLKGRVTNIEMALRSRSFKPSDPAGDSKALDLLKRVSDLCAEAGPRVSVYPHTGFWTERVEDGVRLARKSGRANIGTNFNLVHWYWVRQTRPLEEVLKEARPHLFAVTINGGLKAKRKILPLDEGDYDLVPFMRAVRRVGYTGPVGLQCWSIRLPAEQHLARSMKAWRRLRREVLGEG